MSGQTRILRRAYTGNLSLKTTDHCIKTSLLPEFSSSNAKVSSKSVKLETGLFLCELENVLSSQECAQIIKNADECIFEDMGDKYRFGKQRNNSRLLALDKALAGHLWQNIAPVLMDEMEKLQIPIQPLGFDVTRGNWELHGLNEAMRIGKYSGKKKEYFGPHKDAQYCPSGDERSIFTLLVYLNENFNGGNTCFYFPKDVTQSTKGMTTQEEINAVGSLKKGFNCVKCTPKVGHAVLSSQNMLHESLRTTKGTKYILKTDIVVKRHSKQFGFAVEAREKDDYVTCLNYFREAQQQELQGNFQDASDLYEKALSLRYSYPKSLAPLSSDPIKRSDDPMNHNSSCIRLLPLSVWQHIFKFLPGRDGERLVYAYPELNKAKISWERHRYLNAGCLSDEKFLPKLKYHKGIVTCFEFQDVEFFRENETGCCRVSSLYSFFLLGQKPTDDVYTVRYNPDTQDVCAVALETLLTDIFYNHPCYGSFYNVCQQDVTAKDPKKDFEASVDRNYMLMYHGDEFTGVELPDAFYVKSTSYPSDYDDDDSDDDDDDDSDDDDDDDDDSDDDDDEKEEKKVADETMDEEVGNKEKEAIEKEKEAIEKEKEEMDKEDWEKEQQEKEKKGQGTRDETSKGITDGTVLFNGEIDDSFMVDWLVRMHLRMRDRDSAAVPRELLDLSEGLFDDLKNEEEDVEYFDALKEIVTSKNHVSCTLVSKLKNPLNIKKNTVCICMFEPEDQTLAYIGDSCTTEFYNHLVFDFQTSELSVTCDTNVDSNELLHSFHLKSISEEQELLGCAGEEKVYKVNIAPLLSSGTSFNHASCQCGNVHFEVHEYYSIKDYPYLDHIYLVARELNGKMLVWTLYGGIVAL